MTPKKPTESLGARQATRRTVVKAAAWSAPVIAIAATAPFAAASVTGLFPAGSLTLGYDQLAGSVTASSATFSVQAVGTPGTVPRSTGALTVTTRFPADYTSVSVAPAQSLGNGWVVAGVNVDTLGRRSVVAVYPDGITTAEPGSYSIPTFTTPIIALGAPVGYAPPAESVRVVTSWGNLPTAGQTSVWPNED
jgi:hypothetical protein